MNARQRSLEAPHRRVERGPRVLEKIAVRAYAATAWVVAHVPSRLSRWVIGTGSQAGYLLWPTKRRWSNANFGHVAGLPPDDPQVRRLALGAYREYARYLVEVMHLESQSADEAGGRVVQADLDHIDEVWRGARGGLIFALGHVGNNEAVAAAVAVRGWPINVVADNSSFPEMFERFRRLREAWGVHVIPWRNLREIYAVLRKREMLALLIDWGYRSDGIPVQLFGSWTTLPAGPAALAAKTGSRILPVAIRRTSDMQFRVSYAPVIEVASAAPADLQRATQALADALADTVAAAPDQWYSFKPMWPSDPGGGARARGARGHDARERSPTRGPGTGRADDSRCRDRGGRITARSRRVVTDTKLGAAPKQHEPVDVPAAPVPGTPPASAPATEQSRTPAPAADLAAVRRAARAAVETRASDRGTPGQRVRATVLSGISWLACRLPEGPEIALADLIGRVLYRTSPAHAARARRNLRRVVGHLATTDLADDRVRAAARDPRALERLVRAAFRHHARYYLEILRAPGLDGRIFDDRLVVETPDAVEAALAGDRRAIFISGHLGPIELPGLYLAQRSGRRITAPMETLGDPALQRWFERTRSTFGVRIIGLPEARRELMTELRNGESVGLVADRDISGGGIEVPFFGSPAPLPVGPAFLATETGAPLYLAAIWRVGKRGYRGRLVQVPVGGEGNRRARIVATLEAEARAFEQMIANAPGAVAGRLLPDLA